MNQQELWDKRANSEKRLDVSALGDWLWDAACVIRGPLDAPKFKDYILPLVFLKRLKSLIERDLVEAVVLLPENLFYNTTAPGIILILNKAKPKQHKGAILLINASRQFAKGRPKNVLEEEHIGRIAAAYRAWVPQEGLAAVVTTQEAVRNDYNLSPSRYVATSIEQEVLPLDEAIVLLQEAEEERAEADRELVKVLRALGLGGVHNE
jgi:type I restriction enzyme M protein